VFSVLGATRHKTYLVISGDRIVYKQIQRRAAFRGNAILEERMTKKQERSCS
jgi:hypothetical protein